MKEPVCDFCSAPTAPWVFEADSFVAMRVEGLNLCSEGDWAACDTCKALVEAKDIEGLVKHSAISMIYEHPFVATLPKEVQDELNDSMRNLMVDFFKNRKTI